MAVPGIDRVVVATDDARIRIEAAEGFGAEVVMTPDDLRQRHRTLRRRRRSGIPEHDIVVNLQGDAPLTPSWFVSALVEAMRANEGCAVATPVLRCDAGALAGFLEDRRHGRVGGTTAVFDRPGARSTSPRKCIPYTGRALSRGRGDSGLPPCRRLCLPPGGACRLSRLADRPAGDAGRDSSSCVSWRTERQSLRRGRGAWPAVLGAEQPGGRAADRGDTRRGNLNGPLEPLIAHWSACTDEEIA